MVLPSQGGRVTANRRFMYRRHRLPRGPVMFLVLVITAILVSVWFWRQDQMTEADAADSNENVALGGDNDAKGAADQANNITGTGDETGEALPQSPELGGVMSSVQDDSDRSSPNGIPTLVMGESTGIITAPVENSQNADTSADVSQPATARPEEPAPAIDTRANPAATTERPGRASREVQIGLDLLASNQPVEARRVLSQALLSGQLGDEEAARVRDELTVINDRLVFSPEIVPGDPFVISYTIEGGDALARLPRKFGLQVDWRFLQRVNRLAKPEQIRQGARLKLVTGPFHAVVSKKDFRMDLYMGDERERVYVCSLPVGLGEFNGTPEGLFVVRPRSKATNPAWVNPRTGEQFDADDPANPIGEFWIGLQGVDEAVKDLTGYGVHGTIEPESIGLERSMGCIRMLPEDIALVYEVLMPHASMIEIRRDI